MGEETNPGDAFKQVFDNIARNVGVSMLQLPITVETPWGGDKEVICPVCYQRLWFMVKVLIKKIDIRHVGTAGFRPVLVTDFDSVIVSTRVADHDCTPPKDD